MTGPAEMAAAERLAADIAKARAMINEHGWMIQHVIPTRADPPGPVFFHSVGLTEHGLPELAVSGWMATAPWVLAAAVGMHRECTLFAGDTVTVPAPDPGVVCRVVAIPAVLLGTAVMLYGQARVAGLQLLWPDEHGCYPGDPGWVRPSGEQPILGVQP